MKENKRPFVLKAPTREGISLVVTAICDKCNKVVEMNVKPKKKGTAEAVSKDAELQCPQCQTVYRIPAITKRKGGMTI